MTGDRGDDPPVLSAGTASDSAKPALGPDHINEVQYRLADDLLLRPQGEAKSGHSPYEIARQLSPSPAPLIRPSIEPSSGDGLRVLRQDASFSSSSRTSAIKRFWARNKGPILVAVSQLFAALMNLSARLLEVDGKGMHPIQVLFIRQFMTSACCISYMWWHGTPGFPFGIKEIRPLLFIRGISGFMGIYGMWYSMMYIPLADATVLTFLAPGVAGIICYFVLREPFTRIEQLATLVALLGVVLIAQPATLFADATSDEPSADQSSPAEPPEGPNTTLPGLDHDTTPEERLVAVGVALLGVLGASGAFTTLRAIGKRAHPLISVNFFATTCTIICSVVLIAAPLLDIGQPALSWTWPASLRGWFLLGILGLIGFVMQYLLTAGLAADKSNRANAMVYTHMLFAVSFDRWVFHHTMNVMSFGGCALILGSAIGVVLMKKAPVPQKVEDEERQGNLVGEEESAPMLTGVGGHTDDYPLERIR